VLGLLVLGCSAASATALLYPGREATTEILRPAPRLEKISLVSSLAPRKEESQLGAVATPPTAETKPVGASAPVSAPAAPATAVSVGATPMGASVRQIPLTGGVDPTPPTPPKSIQAAVQPDALAAPAVLRHRAWHNRSRQLYLLLAQCSPPLRRRR
jgi:hypothetical protein